MYTVVRFIYREAPDADVVAVVNALHRKAPGMFTGPDADRKLKGSPDRGDPSRLSLGVCRDDGWWDHRQSLLKFMDECGDVLALANDQGMEVKFDLAIHESDYESRNLTCFLLDLELIQKFAKANASFEFSLYSLSNFPPEEGK